MKQEKHEIRCSEIEKHLGKYCFFEKSYKNTRTKKQAAQQGSLFFDTRRGLERPLKKRAGGTFLGRGRVLSDLRRIL